MSKEIKYPGGKRNWMDREDKSVMALSFEEDLQQLINRHSAESVSGTPDYLLAKLLLETLKTFNDVVTLRAQWRGESTELPALEAYQAPGMYATKEDNG